MTDIDEINRKIVKAAVEFVADYSPRDYMTDPLMKLYKAVQASKPKAARRGNVYFYAPISNVLQSYPAIEANKAVERTLQGLEEAIARARADGVGEVTVVGGVNLVPDADKSADDVDVLTLEKQRLWDALVAITHINWGADGDCGAVAIANEALEESK